MTPYQAILNSFYDGQKRQMVEQIDEMTITDFLDALESDQTFVTAPSKLEILISYNRIKAK